MNDLENYKNLVQKNLIKFFDKYQDNSKYSSVIWESMRYTTLLGGKRLRAIIALEIARNFNLDKEVAIVCACALEIMHAYSLIHDDLPCMDNDDLRRGKPTNHKVFGEAIALLGGDSLISFGAELLIQELKGKIEDNLILEIVKDYLDCAGAKGIIAGQTADILAENKEIDLENLTYIHKYKTGALFKFSFLISAKLAKLQPEILKKLEEYSINFGILFQIYDDIIDTTLTTQELGKTAGKDLKNNKLTYVSAYGIEKAKNIFYSLIDKNYDILSKIGVEMPIFDEIYNLLKEKIK